MQLRLQPGYLIARLQSGQPYPGLSTGARWLHPADVEGALIPPPPALRAALVAGRSSWRTWRSCLSHRRCRAALAGACLHAAAPTAATPQPHLRPPRHKSQRVRACSAEGTPAMKERRMRRLALWFCEQWNAQVAPPFPRSGDNHAAGGGLAPCCASVIVPVTADRRAGRWLVHTDRSVRIQKMRAWSLMFWERAGTHKAEGLLANPGAPGTLQAPLVSVLQEGPATGRLTGRRAAARERKSYRVGPKIQVGAIFWL
jgi:hypothetical protein